MLQQTQVKTVIPYWERWMKALPTIQALASAPGGRVLKLWEGLGYYRRARSLQAAARLVETEHGGRFPESFEEVLKLPGIGRYTAGAICSIAFNQPTPVLDGNVVRVLSRLFGIRSRVSEKKTQDQLWRRAQELVMEADRLARQPRSPFARKPACSHLNQALMEVGALLCTPQQPACNLCPIQSNCRAFQSGRIAQIPKLSPSVPVQARRFAAFIIENRGRFLVRKRPANGVNAELWEFPNVEISAVGSGANLTSHSGRAGARRQDRLRQAARKELELSMDWLEPACRLKHSITRYRITLEVFRAAGSAPPGRIRNGLRWMTLAQAGKLAFTGAHRKVLERIEDLLGTALKG
jgi:A/G-specific adenine glycosylase